MTLMAFVHCLADLCQIMSMADAHKSDLNPAPIRRRKALSSYTDAPPRSNPLNCVTTVMFQPSTNFLITAGANDGAIKIWDMRKIGDGLDGAVKTIYYNNSKKDAQGKGFVSLGES